MQRYNIIKHFFQQYTRRILLLFGLHLVANICALMLPLFVSQMYAHLLGFDSTRAQIFIRITPFQKSPDGQYFSFVHNFPLLFILFSSILTCRFLLDTYRKKQQGILSEVFQHEIRQTIFAHHLKMSIATYEQSGMGRYLMRFSGELTGISHFWSKGILQFSADALLVFLGWGLMMTLDPKTAFIIAVILSICFFVFRILNKKIESVDRKKRNRKSQMLTFFNSRLLAIGSIQAFNSETAEQHRFENQSLKVQKESIVYTAWVALRDSCVVVALYLALGLSLLFMFYEKKNTLTLFDPFNKLAIILVLLTWRQPLLRLFKVGLIWKKGLLSLDSLNRFLTRPINSAYHIKEIKFTPSVLNIENVAFEVNQMNIVNQVKVTIPRKGIYIIDSPYTHTWVKILAGLEHHTEGYITLEKKDIRHLNPRVLRRYITFVSPIFPLYGRTVLESITRSVKKEHSAQMRQILKLWSSIFPPLQAIRPDTPFHENGLGISVMQHQLLRLLNGLSTKKPFLVLEEPLTSLDSVTAHKVWDLLVHESRSKGILIVSKNGDYYQSLLASTLKNWVIEDNP